MDRDRYQGYLIGLMTGMFMMAVVVLAANVESGLGFFLIAFPSTLALYGLGLLLLNANIWED